MVMGEDVNALPMPSATSNAGANAYGVNPYGDGGGNVYGNQYVPSAAAGVFVPGQKMYGAYDHMNTGGYGQSDTGGYDPHQQYMDMPAYASYQEQWGDPASFQDMGPQQYMQPAARGAQAVAIVDVGGSIEPIGQNTLDGQSYGGGRRYMQQSFA